MGLYLPENCLRGAKDCTPLAQIESDCKKSFVCSGHNAPESREWPDDKFRLCWKNSHVDESGDYDYSDMKDTISVLAQALSADEHMGVSQENK